MPRHVHYVEPFAGGLAVLLAKDPEGVSEVVNDLDGALMNFWRVLQNTDDFVRFERVVQAVPFSEVEWEATARKLDDSDPVTRAVGFFIRVRQSLAGRTNRFAPLSRSRTRRGMNEQSSAWLNCIEGLPAVHARLHGVAILNRPALEVIRSQDGAETLYYLDPPYLPETRAATEVYGAFEMTEDQHRELLAALRKVRGKVMLSGYRSGFYDQLLDGWRRHDFELPNNAAGGAAKRRMTECLWCNF
jgi:DNA adenine methylase